jgi:hypothetical protein
MTKRRTSRCIFPSCESKKLESAPTIDPENGIMIKTLNRLTYDATSELVGLLLGAPAGLLSALYQRLFRGA